MSPKIFGNQWQIVKPIAEGGQAFIYLVKDIKAQDDQKYILKRLKKEKRKNRFENEIEAIKGIDSPYVEKILDFNITEGDDFYYVMPHYTEKTLENILASLKGKFIRCLKIFEKICIGIYSAHLKKKPIIHRDLKPMNILIDEKDNPRIIDFGLCYLDDQERNTLSQEQVGSRFYIAPESEMGKSDKIGPHTDVYSLGKILYAMVSGGMIFPRERQKEEEFNLKEIVIDKRIKFITEIINGCVKEKIEERFDNVDVLKSVVKRNIDLLEKGFFPIDYENELCRFCGRGILQRFGQLRGSILKIRNMEQDIMPYEMIIWGCPECGIAYIFKDDLYKVHKD